MRRKLFFFMERLQVQPREVRALSICLLIAIVGFRVVPDLQDRAFRRSIDYREQDRIFLERTADARRTYMEWSERLEHAEEGDEMAEFADSVRDTTDTHQNRIVAETAGTDAKGLQVNLNRLTEEQLQLLPGIGPAYARRIVAWRDRNGPYQSIEQLIEIRGIGEKRLENLRPHIRVSGADADSL